jgi:RHS repeat-associated protein
VSNNAGIAGRIYWDGRQIAYRAEDGTTYFEHQDWLGTERVRTNYTGSAASSYVSLPWGDGYTPNENDPVGNAQDNLHYAQLDHDTESLTEHAQFRQLSSAQGRWMSPDPYDGSYDPTNPQSFNRYAYVLNNPLSYTDPSGLILPGSAGYGGGGECPNCYGGAVYNDGTGSGVGLGLSNTTTTTHTTDFYMQWGTGGNSDGTLMTGVADLSLGSSTVTVFTIAYYGLPSISSMQPTSANATNSAPSNTIGSTPYPPDTPKTTDQCSIYNNGTASGTALYTLCSKVFPNGPLSNKMRGCLQSLYSPQSGYIPLPVLIPTSPGSATDLNSLIPGTGAHLSCALETLGAP